jgi:hypothetical protein
MQVARKASKRAAAQVPGACNVLRVLMVFSELTDSIQAVVFASLQLLQGSDREESTSSQK